MIKTDVWVIESKQVINCSLEIQKILNRYGFPQIMETAILEDLKMGLYREGQKQLKEGE